MAAPDYDPDYTPVTFDAYVTVYDPATAASICPTDAVGVRDASFTYVGKVDGSDLYGRGGLGKTDPCPIVWTDGPSAPFAYDTRYSAVFDGVDPQGGQVRACAKDITFHQDAGGTVTATAPLDAGGARAYWYYEPAS